MSRRGTGGRALRFAVTGALLIGGAAACKHDGEPPHVNEPAPDPPHINEPARPQPQPQPSPHVNEPAPEPPQGAAQPPPTGTNAPSQAPQPSGETGHGTR